MKTCEKKSNIEEKKVPIDVIKDNNKCIGERIKNEAKLLVGQLLCAKHGESYFGMDKMSGSFVWYNEKKNRTKILYTEGQSNDYFMLKEDGRFIVYDKHGNEKWAKKCKDDDVHWNGNCLEKYDCPYLHLHGGGTIVLNYIKSGYWNEKNINKLYDFDD